MYKKSDVYGHLITVGDVCLKKGNSIKFSYCGQNEDIFNYHEIETALCGKEGYPRGERFTPKRILVIQMK